MSNLFRKVQDFFKTSPTARHAEKMNDVPWRWAQLSDGSWAPVVSLATVNAGNGNGDEGSLPKDPETGALVTINTLHSRVHEGNAFMASYYVASLLNTNVIDFLIDINATEMHMVWLAALDGNATLRLYETPTVTAGGTGVNSEGLNRVSSKLSEVRITHTPTITPGNEGTQIAVFLYPGGAGGNAVGSIGRPETEFELPENGLYLMRFTNISGLTKPASLALVWYEVDE